MLILPFSHSLFYALFTRQNEQTWLKRTSYEWLLFPGLKALSIKLKIKCVNNMECSVVKILVIVISQTKKYDRRLSGF